MGRVVAVEVADTSAPLPRWLSPSRAKEFSSCALRFYFTAVLGWRSPVTVHTLVGNVVHAALEDLYRRPPAERTRRAADAALAQRWADAAADPSNAVVLANAAQADELRARAETMLDGLWQLEEPGHINVPPENLEQWVSASLFGAPVRGRIDRMTEQPVWRVSDYKTGRRPAPSYVANALDALFSYAACLAAAHPQRHLPDEVELLYLASGERIVRPVLRPVLLDHARRQGETWRQINSSHDRGVWDARVHVLCGWCPFRPACPAHHKRAPVPGSAASHARLTATGCVPRGSATPPVIEPAEPDLVDPATLPEDDDA